VQCKLAGQFGWTHGIACPSENVVYAAEELNYGVQKLPVQTISTANAPSR
jgi:hypothetical protein